MCNNTKYFPLVNVGVPYPFNFVAFVMVCAQDIAELNGHER